MTNVAHSTLTGSNLHENKGVASATDNHVATASSGSTVFKKLDNTNLAALGNPFGANLIHVQEQQSSSGNPASNVTASTWNTRVLTTTVTNEISSASVSANQISLPAGTYYIEAEASVGSSAIGYSQLRLRNVTDSTTLRNGVNVRISAPSGTNAGAIATIAGRFTLAGTKLLELQHYISGTGAYGPVNSGEVEVYTDVKIWRVA